MDNHNYNIYQPTPHTGSPPLPLAPGLRPPPPSGSPPLPLAPGLRPPPPPGSPPRPPTLTIPTDSSFITRYDDTKRRTNAVKGFEDKEDDYETYHADDICGSGFDGLATTIEIKLNSGELVEAINQVATCISERLSKKTFEELDTGHQEVIICLQQFLNDLRVYLNAEGLPNDNYNYNLRYGFIVRFYDPREKPRKLGFYIINRKDLNINLGGSGKRKRTIRKHRKHKKIFGKRARTKKRNKAFKRTTKRR